jgi:hypothetical protein
MEDKLDDRSPRPPDLQEWIARYGGRPNIPWDKWDAAIAEYKRERRVARALQTILKEAPDLLG